MPNSEYYKNKIRELRQESADPGFALRQAKASLFFDDDAMLEFLAAERFPNDPLGSLRYKIQDGVIMYEDPETGEMTPEFDAPSDASVFDKYLYPNIAPATTFAADLAGGIYGAGKGFEKGTQLVRSLGIKHPLASTAIILGSTGFGGAIGTFTAGAVPRGARLLSTEMFYNVPPEELAAAVRDLGVSSAFSAFPFGAGPTQAVLNKFAGREDTLRFLYNLKKDVQGTIEEARKMGIELSTAEAALVQNGSAKRAADIQYFLSRQPQIQAVHDFYQSRAARAREAITGFADQISSLTGQFLSPQERITRAAAAAVAKLSENRQQRATKLYDALREEEVQVDLAPFIAQLDEVIDNPQTGPAIRKIYQDFRSQLFTKEKVVRRNADGDVVGSTFEDGAPLTDLMTISDRRNTEIEAIRSGAKDKGLERIATELKNQLTSILDEGNELYAFARRVYDPSKPAIEAIEQSAIGRVSGLFTKGADDRLVARSIKDIFDPNVSPRSMRNVRRVLQAADPEGWQQLKRFYIQDQLDRFTKNQALEGGIPNFQRFFDTPGQRRLLEEMLEPDEFANFYLMNDLMGTAFNAVPRGGSPTQGLLSLEEQITREGTGVGTKASELFLSTIRLAGRLLTGTIGDDVLAGISRRQQEAYLDKLAEVMFDPNGRQTIEEVYQIFSRAGYGTKQAATRGGAELVEEITEPATQEYTPTQDVQKGMLEAIDAIENSQSSINLDPFAPLPVTPPPSEPVAPVSTLLPNEEDRLIAMRRSGVAGLI